MSKFILIFILLLTIDLSLSNPWHNLPTDKQNSNDKVNPYGDQNTGDDSDYQYYNHNRHKKKYQHNYYNSEDVYNYDFSDFNGGIFLLLFGCFIPLVCFCGPCVLCIAYVVVKFVNKRQKQKEEELKLRLAALRDLENQRQPQPVLYPNSNQNPIVFPRNEITLESLNSQ